MAVAGWWTDPFGARNAWAGERDQAYFFVVVFGAPVYVSYRGCFHVIEDQAFKDPERGLRLRTFLADLFGTQTGAHASLAGPVLLPLRTDPWLIVAAAWYAVLAVLSLLTVCAVLHSVVLLNVVRPFTPGEQTFLVVEWSAALLFVSLLLPYLRFRAPSSRQKAIREVTAAHLGPFSDLATWDTQLLQRVALRFGLNGPGAEEAILQAERLMHVGQWEDALLRGRLALGLSQECPNQADIIARAEHLTEDCLQSIRTHQ